MSTTSEHDEYRILALKGGGVRGILQAVFPERLDADIGALRERFDLVAATSTGALVGLGIAAGLPARDLVELYRVHLPAVFRAKPAALIRRGGRYRTEPLCEVLAQHFGELRLGELEVDVLICASALNRFQGRIFTRADTDVLVVDAALASAAAPTFFEPVVPEGSERGYLDGGLWANDPLLGGRGRFTADHCASRNRGTLARGALGVAPPRAGRAP